MRGECTWECSFLGDKIFTISSGKRLKNYVDMITEKVNNRSMTTCPSWCVVVFRCS